jgi:FkbM family methyltransferase
MLKRALRGVLGRFGLELLRTDAPGRFVDPFAELKHLGRPVRTIFDVGANVGDVSRRLARDHPAAAIHAFEPVPTTFATLSRNVADTPNIRAHRLALGADVATRTMHLYEDPCLNTLVDRAPFVAAFGTAERDRTTVEVTTVDVFCDAHGISSIDLLKVDTEGFDLDVIRGGEAMFARRLVTFVVFEFTDIRRPAGAGAAGFIEMHDFLEAHGMRLFMVQNDYVVPERNVFAVRNALYMRP